MESPLAFSCTESSTGCAFTLWKDCLTRSGGPEITEKLLRLILEKKELVGSTGTISLKPSQITFLPRDPSQTAIVKSLEYRPKR